MSAHPYTLPGCRAPRGLIRSSGTLLVLHWGTALGVSGPLILPAEMIVVAYVCHGGTAWRLMCATASPGRTLSSLDTPFHCLFPNRYRLDGDVPEYANATEKNGEIPPTLANQQISKPRDTNFRRKAPSTLV
jgi:hypothetical protein